MLNHKQVKEIKEHLEKAQNPVFFFDNDPDGLCSFLLLQRYIKRGKGVAIKSFPEMNAEYSRKAAELNADYVFILDKPIVSEEFFEEIKSFNIPVVWIDHHEVQVKVPDYVHYYNPSLKKKKNEPVTSLCYQITNREEDLWLAVAGCISDRFIPKYYPDFSRKYPDLSVKSKDAFDIFFKSRIGEVAKIFSFALKDTTSNVVQMIKFLASARSPYDVLEETAGNRGMHSRFKQIYRKYQKLIEKAKSLVHESRILFFQYAGEISMSADLANELSYLFPEKIIVIARISGIKVSISARGEKVRDILSKAIEDIEGARGGGHENAVGATMKVDDLERFRKRIETLLI